MNVESCFFPTVRWGSQLDKAMKFFWSQKFLIFETAMVNSSLYPANQNRFGSYTVGRKSNAQKNVFS